MADFGRADARGDRRHAWHPQGGCGASRARPRAAAGAGGAHAEGRGRADRHDAGGLGACPAGGGGADGASRAGAAAQPVPCPAGPRTLAYLCFTSGSTGLPKAVEVEHRGILRLVLGADWCDFGSGRAGDADGVARLRRVDIRGLGAAPPRRHAGAARGQRAVALRTMPGPSRRMASRPRGSRRGSSGTWWMHGPTRWQGAAGACRRRRGVAGPCAAAAGGAHRGSAHQRLRADREHDLLALRADRRRGGAGRERAIGIAIANSTAWILDDRMRPVPFGAEGDLYVGGDGVARGYRGRPEATAAAFLPDPFDPAARRAALPHRGPGAIPGGRADGVHGTPGRADQDPRLPGGDGRDRGRTARTSRRPRRGGDPAAGGRDGAEPWRGDHPGGGGGALRSPTCAGSSPGGCRTTCSPPT